ncbi:MAG TPA: class I SAM-dependent methyltransferase [Streptosporangiaceae bacterium]|nr:class I SAM-dependent methyltransferase [Streptosporangiaceae bacterium]
MRTFDDLVSEAEAAPVEGWDFSWLDGRATEERPPWGYSRVAAARMAGVSTALDLDTGGGEVLAALAHWPPHLVATESWPPNTERAARLLRPRGAWLVATGEGDPALPFRDGAFDLVVSRHPVATWWDEVARVLRPGGTFLAQEIGPDTNAELHEAIAGPVPAGEKRSAQRSRRLAEEAGLAVTDLREASLRVEFYDIGAVVYFLRKVVWTIPGFSVARYRSELAALHERIQANGPFVSHAQRFLIEAHKPGN